MAEAALEIARPRAALARGKSGRAKSAKAASGRLSRDDWIAAGQAVLCDVGIAGLRLSTLTRRLRVSTGSFYHHFIDMEDFLGALARHFSEADVQSILVRATTGAGGPLSRIRRLAAISLDSPIFRLDRAMRVWATSDARAAASLKASERLVLAFLTDAFAELGFARDDAALRAHLLLSANVALIGEFRLGGDRELFKRSLELLSRDAPRLAPEAAGPREYGRAVNRR
ncbi:MAG: TetR/AcrR family transcriptional regulator [Alphaproteobacteria bacterium]|nr:TetR/AcrR family transcriptional regulator [Alphaproteobacteria bacterium]